MSRHATVTRGGTGYTSSPSLLPHPPHPGTRREARKQIKAAVERRHPVLVGRPGKCFNFPPRVFNPLRSPFSPASSTARARVSLRKFRATTTTSHTVAIQKKKKKKKGRVWTSGNICLGRLFVLLSGTPVCWEGKHCDKKNDKSANWIVNWRYGTLLRIEKTMGISSILLFFLFFFFVWFLRMGFWFGLVGVDSVNLFIWSMVLSFCVIEME